MISQELIDVVYPVDEVSECYVGTQELKNAISIIEDFQQKLESAEFFEEV